MPIEAATGIKRRKSGPANIHAKWGMTIPTRPIMPAMLTIRAVKKVAAMMT